MLSHFEHGEEKVSKQRVRIFSERNLSNINNVFSNTMLRNIVIFLLGVMLLVIGSFQLHTNLVIFVFIGITFVICSVSMLDRDMKKYDVRTVSEKNQLSALSKLSLESPSLRNVNESTVRIKEDSIAEVEISAIVE